MNKIRFLKVKVKSLAAEARIIRLEEQRSYGELRDELHDHRCRELRYEARATHVAYGYLRGRTLLQIEPVPRTEAGVKEYKEPDWERVKSMVKKYGEKEQLTALEAWRKTVEKLAA